MTRTLRIVLLFVIPAVLLAACASRVPVEPGDIPEPETVSVSDEQYGHYVLNEMTERFPLDTNDNRINRVRDIVDQLTSTGLAGNDPWHVYVLYDDEFANASATRGNYIFIWTAMVDRVQNDDELAAILAHEVAHVLAKHTAPDPAEQVGEILASVASEAARTGIIHAGGPYAGLAVLGAALAGELVKSIATNPVSQEKELEADHIGLFLMAEAGYDPEAAVIFWDRVQNDPAFSGGFLPEFFSTHPSSEDRVDQLRAHLPEAEKRYKGEGTKKTSKKEIEDTIRKSKDEAKKRDTSHVSGARSGKEIWEVAEDKVIVFETADDVGEVEAILEQGEEVTVDVIQGRWLKISSPVDGYVRSHKLAPK